MISLIFTGFNAIELLQSENIFMLTNALRYHKHLSIIAAGDIISANHLIYLWRQGMQKSFHEAMTWWITDPTVWLFWHGLGENLQTGRGRSWITGLAGISRLGPNSEPRGNNRSIPETRERARAPVKKIGSRDSIFGLVNSTYFFKITNHNQHAFTIKYLANLIKKYWTCFRCQKLVDFMVCFPPSVRVQVRRPPSWKICLRIKLSFGFWSRAVKAFDNYSRKLAWLLKTIF